MGAITVFRKDNNLLFPQKVLFLHLNIEIMILVGENKELVNRQVP